MKIYTRAGDFGETGLIGGNRVSKSDPTIDALGEVDELNACLGLSVAAGLDPSIEEFVVKAQSLLFDLGADVASKQDIRFQVDLSNA
ncbi:MAG: ATP:cob(I)alamin adenosyltransferase, partial [bacterium]